MTDILIRDVPEDVVAALDAQAGRLGLSRSEYVRRRLAQDAARQDTPVSVEDLARFADVFGDLADPGGRANSHRRSHVAWMPVEAFPVVQALDRLAGDVG